jgi:hypothetical protein
MPQARPKRAVDECLLLSELLPRHAFKGELAELSGLLSWVEQRAAAAGSAVVAPATAVREALEKFDRGGRNSLLSAVRGQQVETVSFLLRLGANPNATTADASCDTALHLASRRNHSKLVECLVAAGADAGARNAQGRTPLEVSLSVAGSADGTAGAAGPRALRRVRKTLRCALGGGGGGGGDGTAGAGAGKCVPLQEQLSQAGKVLDLSDREAMLLVQGRLDAAVCAAPTFAMSAACELPDELRAVALADHVGAAPLPATPPRGPRGWDWDHVTKWRIQLTYGTRHASLVWLDDKLLQVTTAARLLGAPQVHAGAAAPETPDDAHSATRAPLGEHHLPVLACAAHPALRGLQSEPGRRPLLDAGSAVADTAAPHTAAGATTTASEAASFVDVLKRCVASNEPLAIKPRHGANGHAIALFPTPGETGLDALLSACEAALEVDNTRLGENWQLAQVPRGVVVQPLYCGFGRSASVSSEAALARPSWQGQAPLELKVQTMFGVVIGATLHTHPWQFWVLGGCDKHEGGGGGALHAWREVELEPVHKDGKPNTSKRLRPPRKWRKLHGAELPPAAVSRLCAVLRRDWRSIAALSSRLATRAGLDELRVDWLVGDERWGPRIGELTYIGGAERLVPNLSKPFGRAFLAAHRQRLVATSTAAQQE